MSYNGWSNRETWLFYIHFKHHFQELEFEVTAADLLDFHQTQIEELDLPVRYLSDLLWGCSPDFQELADALNEEIKSREVG